MATDQDLVNDERVGTASVVLFIVSLFLMAPILLLLVVSIASTCA